MDARDFSDVTRCLQDEVDRRESTASTTLTDSSRLIGSIRSQVDAISQGDYDTVLSQAHDDVTLDIFAPPQFSWIRQTRDPVELRRALAHNFGSLDGQIPKVTQIVVEGETVVLFGREQGRIRATGEPYDVEFVDRFTFRDGRLAAIRIIVAQAGPAGTSGA